MSLQIIRAPGRLVANPTTSLATTSFPYGGTYLGLTSGFSIVIVGQKFLVWSESYGAIGDVLQEDTQYEAMCLVRGWTDDAISELFASVEQSTGSISGHKVLSRPVVSPGVSVYGTAIKVLFVPDNPKDVPAVMLYAALPDLEENERITWSRSEELGMPIKFLCLLDGSGRAIKIGRLVDLPL